MPIPKSSIDQANYDAYRGKMSGPRNAFQKALDRLQKITGQVPEPSPKGRTSAQQAALDAKTGGKAMKAYGKGKGLSVPKLGASGVGTALRGGGNIAVYAAANAAVPPIAREAMRGLGVVTGMDTSGFDAINSGRPVIKSIDGVDFNVATPEGREGYKNAGGLDTRASSPLASLGRYDDIPAALYPEGVSTGVGGGNAAQSDYTPLSEPAPKPGLNNGDELSREINQTNLNSFAKSLESGKVKGIAPIQFRHGFNSNDLPGSDGTYSHGDAQIMGQRSVQESRAVMSPEGLEVLIDGNNVSFPQSGVSPIADEADSARAVPVPGRPKLEGISLRSRAILDHEGGMLGALRAAEASQGYIRQGGKNYAITGEDDKGNYTFTEFNDEGLKQLKNDRSSIITHEFMDQYAAGDRPTPDQAQSPEVAFTTKEDLETINSLRETPVAFGVGDGSAEQLIDFPNNYEKMVLDPADWMSRYRDLKIS